MRPFRWSLLLALPSAALAWWLAARQLPVAGISAPALAVAIGAAVPLAWPGTRDLMTTLAFGAASGLFLAAIQQHGAPFPMAVLFAVALPATAWWLTRLMPHFAPAVVRDDALVLLTVIGLAVATLPALVEGWRTAVSLNVAAGEGNRQSIPAWALALSGASAALGGCYSAWRHR